MKWLTVQFFTRKDDLEERGEVVRVHIVKLNIVVVTFADFAVKLCVEVVAVYCKALEVRRI